MIGHECRCPGCGSCDAAQEVERLRDEVVRLRFAAKALYDKPYVDSLRAERDRYREALLEVSRWREDCHEHDEDMGHPLRDWDEEQIEAIEKYASRVLGEGDR